LASCLPLHHTKDGWRFSICGTRFAS
jgi:hypothetical protein